MKAIRGMNIAKSITVDDILNKVSSAEYPTSSNDVTMDSKKSTKKRTKYHNHIWCLVSPMVT